MPRKVNSNKVPGGKVNNFLNNLSGNLLDFKSSKKLYIVVLVLGLLLLGFYKKSLFVAAVINGTPLTNLELQSKLNQQFRTQTLNQLVNEKIILEEARKMNALPGETEVDQKIKELETQVGGGPALDSLLSQQGQTRVSLRDQIRIQLAITKMYGSEATVSAEEVTKFIEENKDNLQSTDSASLEKEATDTLKQQKLSQIFNEKFQELRTKAKIQIF